MEVQLQSILKPRQDTEGIEQLYYHKHENQIDFDGYFNLFYLKKRKAYTLIHNLHLSLQLRGYEALLLYHDREMIKKETLEPEREQACVVELPFAEYEDGVFWFGLLEKEEPCPRGVSGWFGTDTDKEQCQNVNIGITICTYHREVYVEKNLAELENLMNGTKEIASHIWIYVVDNGRTLNECRRIQEIQQRNAGRLHIIPNKNAGGSGGFTRGMLEVLKDQEMLGLTHVLLMDDDVVLEPDALVRLYGLLVTRRQQWQRMAVGGAMMREDCPYMLFCAGEKWENGKILQPESNLDLRSFSNAVTPYLTDTGHEKEWYSGWWFCCYSLEVVRKNNLPIPFFLHQDDIEFGLRNRKSGIVFMNGIGVWHKSSDLTFNGSNVYYDVRNNLIEMVLHGTEKVKKNALKSVVRSVTAAAIWLRCRDASMVYRGFRDFLRGPKWLFSTDPEKLHRDIGMMGYQLKPVEEVISKLPPKDKDTMRRELAEYERLIKTDIFARSREKKGRAKWYCYLTYNGWLLPANRRIKLVASLDSPFDAFRRQRVLLFEPGSRKAVVVRRNYKDLGKIIMIYIKIVAAFLLYFDAACKNYRDYMEGLTNQSAWEEYLKEQ